MKTKWSVIILDVLIVVAFGFIFFATLFSIGLALLIGPGLIIVPQIAILIALVVIWVIARLRSKLLGTPVDPRLTKALKIIFVITISPVLIFVILVVLASLNLY